MKILELCCARIYQACRHFQFQSTAKWERTSAREDSMQGAPSSGSKRNLALTVQSCYNLLHNNELEWRNWQTQQTQNLPPVTRHGGSTPPSSTSLTLLRSELDTRRFFICPLARISHHVLVQSVEGRLATPGAAGLVHGARGRQAGGRRAVASFQHRAGPAIHRPGRCGYRAGHGEHRRSSLARASLGGLR